MIRRLSIILLSTLVLLSACGSHVDTVSFEPEWYRGSSVVSANGRPDLKAIDAEKIDLIYLVSTEVLSASNADGTKVWQSTLSDEDRVNIDSELAFADKNFSQGDFNFFAPYYHQFTFEAIQLPEAEFWAAYEYVRQEVAQVMDYYLAHVNQGRKFALVGFSQGAMLVADVLKHCRPEQLQNMVGAYMLGYGLNEADVKHPNITPATGATGFGHTISINSVMSPEATWPFVYNNAVTTINPVNWRTDATAATLTFDGQQLIVTLDDQLHELIVTVPDKKPYHDFMNANPAYQMAGVSPDCLHRWDLLFYTQQIHDNILERARR